MSRSVTPAFLPFLLPHLQEGMDILDAGCGVGSIALDLAPKVAPGRIFGVDIDPMQIEVARRSAAEREVDNVEFHTASLYELPFGDASFDIVYSNAVLMYLSKRVRALAETRRVLRPGGLAAVIDDDHSTVVISPDCPELLLAFCLFARVVSQRGGYVNYSRGLRGLMLKAGFARTQGVANAPEVYADAATTRWFADLQVELLSDAGVGGAITGEGWVSRADLDSVVAALCRWADRPDAFVAWPYCGALGRVSESNSASVAASPG